MEKDDGNGSVENVKEQSIANSDGKVESEVEAQQTDKVPSHGSTVTKRHETGIPSAVRQSL